LSGAGLLRIEATAVEPEGRMSPDDLGLGPMPPKLRWARRWKPCACAGTLPLANQRTDEYGGSLENRMRFPLEVFDAGRAVFPADKPAVCGYWRPTEWRAGQEQTVAFAQALNQRGCTGEVDMAALALAWSDPVRRAGGCAQAVLAVTTA
jgi:2,4-dienoyl-CoA reductase-like NADH-dependent reductase (Old Yellow Enzyme family)